ncbi:MAG: thiamine pyrophosphate-binding protein [Candidatus Micrarchaeota archaeon]|nr:thiamine pyrophosphate-binding protein [Candidatus Micrarchaeota archaeon]
MKLSDYVVDFLLKENISRGFFMIGGSVGHIADSCASRGLILHTMHHEQAAAFAAEAQAIVTRGLGLAMATSGPGATNLITGIGSSYFASIPVVFITGQVNTFESNLSGKRRQVGFQETDIVSIVKTITKYAIQIQDPEMIKYELEKAIFISKHGRMGPVLIDLPFNVQKSDVDASKLNSFIGSEEYKKLSKKKELDLVILKKVADALRDAERPIILLGHGVRLSNAEENMIRFIEKTSIPVVVSLLGTDSIPNNHPLFYGFIGTYGSRSSNFALANADLILVLGARLDSRQVGVQSKKFAPMAKIIHVDIDESELGGSVTEWLSVNSDINAFLTNIFPFLHKSKDRNEWLEHLNWLKKTHLKVPQNIGKEEIDPVDAVSLLSDIAEEGNTIVVDVGSNQMWFAHGWKAKKGQNILTNGGMAPMGYALPAAIGASLSRNNCPVWVVTGDGGLQVNIQELQTVVRNKLPIKILVLNNQSLGMLTQFQTENFEGRLTGSVDGYDSPDFVKISRAYGISSEYLVEKKDLKEKISWLTNQKGAALLDVRIPITYWVLPKSRHSTSVHDMFPYLDRAEYKKALKYVTPDL